MIDFQQFEAVKISILGPLSIRHKKTVALGCTTVFSMLKILITNKLVRYVRIILLHIIVDV